MAIAGFLFQILRAVRLGLEVTAEITADGHAASMALTIEPDTSGDIQITRAAGKATEQVKMRSRGRWWTSGEIGREVLPDLLRGVELGSPQDFRFVTDNAAGLDQLRAESALLHHPAQMDGVAPNVLRVRRDVRNRDQIHKCGHDRPLM